MPGRRDTLTGLAQRAERRGDHVLLARAGLEMDPLGDTGWDGEIGRICQRALAGPELDGPLRVRVVARRAQVLVHRGEYGHADEVSRTALDPAELTGDPDALVDTLRAPSAGPQRPGRKRRTRRHRGAHARCGLRAAAGAPATTVQVPPAALPDLRHDVTQHIVSIYQFDILDRWLAVARLTREPR